MSRVRALFQRDRLASEVDEELQYHLAMRAAKNAREGMTAKEAHEAARRSFGNVTLLKERTRDADLLVFLETVLKDLHFAARMLAKHRGFTALAVMALAVGIGVNTAVFTACKAILTQPLDGKDPQQLVNVYRLTGSREVVARFSYPDFEYYRERTRTLAGVVAMSSDQEALTDAPGAANRGTPTSGGLVQAFGFQLPSLLGASSQFASVASVSDNYFAVLGVNAILGRVFLPQDTKELDEHPAILLSENFWRRRFAGDPSVLGKTVKLNGQPFTIIGITPHDFMGTVINVPNIWMPMRLWPSQILRDRENAFCALHARLAPEVSLERAQAEMTLLANQLRSLHAKDSEGSKTGTIMLTKGSHLGPMHVTDDPGLTFALLLILGAVGLVLLIACANVGSLQLARSAARLKEVGIRLSVGASRGRIVRQLLTESALLGLIAGAVSLLATWSALRLLMMEIATKLPLEWGTMALHVAPDLQVFAYVFVVSLLASVLFGLAPALQASRPSLSSSLKEEGSGFALRLSHSRLRSLMIATQAAASLFLLIGAGLLIRGSIRSMALSPGYDTKHVMSLQLTFPAGFDYNHAKQMAELKQIVGRLGNVAGVQSVALGVAPDGGGLREAAVGLNGNAASLSKTARTVFYTYVTANYFECIRIPLIAGQTFVAQSTTPEAAVILSESAAVEFWPGENAIGKRVALDASKQFHDATQAVPQGTIYEVIGVVKDARAIIPGGEDVRKAYLQMPSGRIDNGMPMLVRVHGNPTAMLSEFSKQLQAVDPNIVVYATTLEGLLTFTPTFVVTRMSAIFASLIGVLGLVLASVGIYGTVSYAVTRRTREVGIRMALGARKVDVLRLVVMESGRPVIVGLLVGVVAAGAASRVLASMLFGLGTLDPISFVGVGVLFLGIAMLAAYVPARRAAQIDPMAALRCD